MEIALCCLHTNITGVPILPKADDANSTSPKLVNTYSPYHKGGPPPENL